MVIPRAIKFVERFIDFVQSCKGFVKKRQDSLLKSVDCWVLGCDFDHFGICKFYLCSLC